MDKDLERLRDEMERATLPEDVFGQLHGSIDEQLAGLRESFRRLAKIAHPDGYVSAQDQAAAHDTFTRLNLLYQHAEERVRVGSYRNPNSIPVDAVYTIQSQKHEYHLTGQYQHGAYTLNYAGGYIQAGRWHPVEIHLAVEPVDNGIVRNEAAILTEIRKSENHDKFSAYLPEMVESFDVQVGTVRHAAIVFAGLDGWYTLQQVHERYPDGVDARDMAWIYRRLLAALGFLHTSGVVHCAVLPANVLIQPEQHGLMLVHFGSSFSAGGAGRSLPIACAQPERQWYPPDMVSNRIVTSATDLYLAARCMRFILGADPVGKGFPAAVPQPIASFLTGCLMSTTRSCPSDAWALKEEFDEGLGKLWGKRKFHPFTMAFEQAAQYQGGKNG